MNHIPRLSEAVYAGLCREVGSPTEVKFRRELLDTEDVVNKPLFIIRGFERMKSGSKREGFRLRTSDTDWMFWPPDHKVICDISQINLYRIPQHIVILMECDDLPPGFTRLNLISQSNKARINSSCVVMNNNVYILSTLFRDNHLHFLNTSNIPITSAIPHGPCSTYSEFQDTEDDLAFCFQSHHWPTSALPWIQRCYKRGWPDRDVVFDILSGGFHVVPIGSTPENEQEWRISFSRGEQKLVYAMNHCQFLCYGLFKFFLKEVINCQTNESILCSYFIKTTILWVIQTNSSLSWTPDNLLNCFWTCFKLTIYMVRTGYCPNFFIPKNNMFRSKVTGSVQTSLFNQLYDFYCNGISCLLLSDTIRPYLSIAILNRTLRICTDEISIISSTELDKRLYKELHLLYQGVISIEDLAVYMNQVQIMIKKRLTPYETVSLQCITSNMLRETAMFLQTRLNQSETRNKALYEVNKGYILLKQSCKFGFLSDIMYLAMYFYRTRRYENSLSYLNKAQEGMSLPYVMYRDHVNVDMYRHYMEKSTLGTKMRRAVMRNIMLCFLYIYIDELVLEQEISKKHGMCALFIPPLVMLNMLLILNHHRLGHTVTSQQSIRDLQTLLLYDDGVYVPYLFRDISWQLLGICQQICGDYSGSLRSYQYSSQQKPFHKIQEATLFRKNTLPM